MQKTPQRQDYIIKHLTLKLTHVVEDVSSDASTHSQRLRVSDATDGTSESKDRGTSTVHSSYELARDRL